MSGRSQTNYIPLVAMATFLGVYMLIPPPTAETPASGSAETSRYYRNCAAARAAGAAPIHAGQPGYRDSLDRDGDGIACEPYRGG